MVFGALGDIHGDFEAARRIMKRHREVPFWLCVGDVADAQGNYQPLPAPLYWIKGNNENFDVIDPDLAGRKAPPYESAGRKVPPYDSAGCKTPPYAYIPNGEVVEIDGLRVAGLGGTFAPTMYEVKAADLPHPKKGTAKATELADRRRHFVREEVERCKGMSGVDVFLSHEAPVPFRVGRVQAGKRPINEILAAMQPRLHLFGHHHRFQELTAEGVRSVCLDQVGVSYLLIDRNTLEYQHLSS